MRQILIVDDDDNIREMLHRYLTELGLEPESAASGEEALALLADNRPDLLLLDVLLPGVGGIEVLQRTLKRYPDLPVVMISGFADEELARKALDMGAYDFFLKPFSLDTVKSVLAVKLDMLALQKEAAAQPA